MGKNPSVATTTSTNKSESASTYRRHSSNNTFNILAASDSVQEPTSPRVAIDTSTPVAARTPSIDLNNDLIPVEDEIALLTARFQELQCERTYSTRSILYSSTLVQKICNLICLVRKKRFFCNAILEHKAKPFYFFCPFQKRIN